MTPREESAQVNAMIGRKIALWKAAYERGDYAVLCDAKVAQTDAPGLLLVHLKVPRSLWRFDHR